MFFKTLDVRNILLFLALVSFPAYHAFAHEIDLQNNKDHIFSAGEKIHITVLNENDLTNNYQIDNAGMILMPLLGKVHVAGLRPSKIEMFLTQYLKDGYLIEPIISVNTNSKPQLKNQSFYILGEVKNPGRYIMPDDHLNLLNAVALAGGFTYRANTKEFEIMRSKGDDKNHTKHNSAKSALRSGDIIIVKERFF